MLWWKIYLRQTCPKVFVFSPMNTNEKPVLNCRPDQVLLFFNTITGFKNIASPISSYNRFFTIFSQPDSFQGTVTIPNRNLYRNPAKPLPGIFSLEIRISLNLFHSLRTILQTSKKNDPFLPQTNFYPGLSRVVFILFFYLFTFIYFQSFLPGYLL